MKSELSKEILVKVRSTGKLLEAKVDLKNDNSAEINLKDFEDGISPGQACVFYEKDELGHKVLGGGWIIN
jgi:tRNA-specific 2-thiouridylase